eukprot:270282-Prorocentrum_minimum.AAC.1
MTAPRACAASPSTHASARPSPSDHAPKGGSARSRAPDRCQRRRSFSEPTARIARAANRKTDTRNRIAVGKPLLIYIYIYIGAAGKVAGALALCRISRRQRC